jgi:hypothetical protein
MTICTPQQKGPERSALRPQMHHAMTLDRYAAPNENFVVPRAAEPRNGLRRAERAKRYCQLAKGILIWI